MFLMFTCKVCGYENEEEENYIGLEVPSILELEIPCLMCNTKNTIHIVSELSNDLEKQNNE